MPHPEAPPRLTFRRWLDLYLPLSMTFILMSGSTPFISAGIGRLPEGMETTGFYVFPSAFVIGIFLYSPCFAIRDIGIKFIRGPGSYRRVFAFNLLVAAAGTALLLVVALSSLFDRPVLAGFMNIDPALIGAVKRSVLGLAPIPFLVTIRGVHQATHITNGTAKWVGIGTLCRLFVLIGFVFLVGVPLQLEGGLIGSWRSPWGSSRRRS